MKKHIIRASVIAVLCVSLIGCGAPKNTKEIADYKEAMELFFENMETINEEINAIDPESQDALDSLYKEFDKLEKQFSIMASLDVPTENVPETFKYIEALADEASAYMVQSNEYLKEAYDDIEYSENTLAGAIECYNRANKRMYYIIDLLHGNLPQDENISYTN